MRNRLFAAAAVAIAVAAVAALTVAGSALAGGRPFETALTGAAEVPGPGDPDGVGTAHITLNQGQGTVCAAIDVANIATPVAAHIHVGPADVAGPIVVNLSPALASGEACIDDVDRGLIKAIRQHPDEYYVNVHTPDFPAGAIRGQLGK